MSMTKNGVPAMKNAVRILTNLEVLVGIPADEAKRPPEETGKTIVVKGQAGRPDITIKQTKQPDINNAELGYIHEFGDPACNIPARPFLFIGIRNGIARFTPYLRQAAAFAFSGNAEGVERAFGVAGAIARDSVKARIVSGPFVPLAPATLAARERRGVTRTSPLIDTSAMLGSINYVIRKINKRIKS